MQASAPISTSTTATLLPHSQTARSNPSAPQPGLEPQGFGASLAQAQVTPETAILEQAGPLGGVGKAALLSTALSPPTPIVAATAPVLSVTKAADGASAKPVARPEQDAEPVKPDEIAKIVPPLGQVLLTIPAPLPESAMAALMPKPLAEPDTASSAATTESATDATPAQTVASLAAPAMLGPALLTAVRPGMGGPILHADSGQPPTVADHGAKAPMADGALEAPTAVSSALSIPATSAMAMLSPHVAASSPPLSHPAVEPSGPSPAAQVGPALASFAASAAQPGAAQHLTIQLDPAELGRVQVRIERTPDGPARVELVVERPDTLLLLLRDQPQLHRALDLAGIPAADRTLQFQLAPANANPGAATPQFNADPGPGQQRPGQPRQHGSNNGGTTFSDEPTIRPATTFRRTGVDIMA